jgi:hypothetical protein
MKFFSLLLLAIISVGLFGCASTEVSADDASKFGKESEEDKKARESGEQAPSQPDR